MICTKCKQVNDSANYKNMSNPDMCFLCNYWHDALAQPDKLIINGCIYFDCGWSNSGCLGFGGRKFTYRKLTPDSLPITTNNLWNGARIPELWHMPDNAEFI
jgi:hypothetical protein